MMKALAERIKKFNSHLLADMVELKYKAMLGDPFHFFRGTCHLFYEDLSQTVPLKDFPVTWICGDLHLENFGSFRAANRMVYFDLNDFDESALAFVNWELLRVVTSIFVAFDALNIDTAEATEMADLFLQTYSRTLAAGKARYIDPRTAKGIVKDFLRKAEERKVKEQLAKQTDTKSKQHKIKINHKTHFKLDKALKDELTEHLTGWIRASNGWLRGYKVIDAAFRVAGTGSIGLKRYLFLLQHGQNHKELLLVEMKQCRASSLAPYNPVPQPDWASEAERVIEIKYIMQNISPALLNTIPFKDDDYVIQEMQPSADKINFELIENEHKCIRRVITDMAILTASAHIRSSGRHNSAIVDELILFGKRSDWQQDLNHDAAKYARQVKKYYESFKAAYLTGLYAPA